MLGSAPVPLVPLSVLLSPGELGQGLCGGGWCLVLGRDQGLPPFPSPQPGWGQGMDGTIAAAASLGGVSGKKYFKNIKDLGNTDVFFKTFVLYISTLHWFD